MKHNFRINSWTDKEVEAHWDRVASIYITENHKVKDTHDQRFKRMLELLPHLPEGSEVLNITSRDGEASVYIERIRPGVKVLNAEISSGLMQEAYRLWPGIRQVKIETYGLLSFADHSFDAIVSLETLEHAAEPLKFLQELYRVAKPGATLVLSCPPATSELPYRIYTAVFGGHGEGPHRFPSSKEVKQMMKEAGWMLVHHEGTLLLPVGPKFLKNGAEWLIRKFQHTFIRELGIRQFYVAKKENKY